MNRKMKQKLCDYCGEEKAQIEIPNPNTLEEDFSLWNVCITCKNIIDAQMELSFGLILKGRKNPIADKMSKKIIEDSKKKISRLSYESGKEVFGIELNLEDSLKV